MSSALQVGRGLSFFPPLIVAAVLPTPGYQPIVFLSVGLFGVLALVAWLFRETRGIYLAAEEILDQQPKSANSVTASSAHRPESDATGYLHGEHTC